MFRGLLPRIIVRFTSSRASAFIRSVLILCCARGAGVGRGAWGVGHGVWGVGRGAWGQWTLPQSSIMFVVYEEILSFMLLTFPPSPETARMRTSVSL